MSTLGIREKNHPILRYGGNTAYHKAVPFFLGLILGDYIMGAFWSLYGPARGVMAYQIFH